MFIEPPRRVARVVLPVVAFLITILPSWAQNENETVGFQSNHMFEGGQFGENIDILNGGLNLTIPIGPRYQVTENLGYQLQLVYNSKIWDTSRWGDLNEVSLRRHSNMGLGFTLQFGRIYRDVDWKVVGKDSSTGNAKYDNVYTWTYVSPDGNEHELPGWMDAYGTTDAPDIPQGPFLDGTFNEFDSALSLFPPLWDGTGDPPVFHLRTPEGLRYTFSHFIQVGNLNSQVAAQGLNATLRDENRDFGGWYVTLIEDEHSEQVCNITQPWSSRFGDVPTCDASSE